MRSRKSPPDASRTVIVEYALLTALLTLIILGAMAFLRFGTG